MKKESITTCIGGPSSSPRVGLVAAVRGRDFSHSCPKREHSPIGHDFVAHHLAQWSCCRLRAACRADCRRVTCGEVH
jgi:hypothetical protein